MGLAGMEGREDRRRGRRKVVRCMVGILRGC